MTKVVQIQGMICGPSPDLPLIGPLSLELSAGECCWIQGPNGTGKTTLLRALLGQAAVHEGHVQLPPLQDMVYLPQVRNKYVPWTLTLHDVLSMTSNTTELPPRLAGKTWNTASGGEQQRTLLLRALQKNPALLVLDEPLTHLDQGSRQECEGLFSQYLSEGGALIVVEHSMLPDSLQGAAVKQLNLEEMTYVA